MVDFRAIIDNLIEYGVYDVILPFILVYVIVFAILEKSKIFNVKGDGDDNKHIKSVNSVIALVFGLFAIAAKFTVQAMQNLIVNVVVFIIFILVVLILLGFIFGEDYKQLFMTKDGDSWTIKKWAAWTIGLIVIIVSVIALMYATDTIEPVKDFFNDLFDIDSDSFWTVVIIGAIGGVLYLVTKDSNGNKSSS
jgi:hypothetical protein